MSLDCPARYILAGAKRREFLESLSPGCRFLSLDSEDDDWYDGVALWPVITGGQCYADASIEWMVFRSGGLFIQERLHAMRAFYDLTTVREDCCGPGHLRCRSGTFSSDILDEDALAAVVFSGRAGNSALSYLMEVARIAAERAAERLHLTPSASPELVLDWDCLLYTSDAADE